MPDWAKIVGSLFVHSSENGAGFRRLATKPTRGRPPGIDRRQVIICLSTFVPLLTLSERLFFVACSCPSYPSAFACRRAEASGRRGCDQRSRRRARVARATIGRCFARYLGVGPGVGLIFRICESGEAVQHQSSARQSAVRARDPLHQHDVDHPRTHAPFHGDDHWCVFGTLPLRVVSPRFASLPLVPRHTYLNDVAPHADVLIKFDERSRRSYVNDNEILVLRSKI